MINIVAKQSQIFSLFGKSNFKLIEKEKNDSIFDLEYNEETYRLKIIGEGYAEIQWNSPEWKNQTNFWEKTKNNILYNPTNDLIIVADRWIFVSVFVGLFQRYGISYIKKLEKIYKERNVKVVLANSYFEPLDYETDHYSACNHPYDFDFIRFSDYPLFEDCKNTTVNTFYSLWNYVYDILAYDVSPNNRPQMEMGDEVYNDWLNTLVTPIEERPYVFGMLGGKPRYHRLYFINKCIESGLVDRGYLTMNKWFLDEYHRFIDDDNLYTDGAQTLKPAIKKYWNRDFYKDKEYYKDIKDPLGEELRFEYSTQNIVNQEYNESYIEVIAETHILWDKLYGFWSEKTYHGIFFEKLFVSVGANRFYKEFEKLGGHTFIKELGINPLFLEEDDPIIQMDYLIEALDKISLDDAKRIYTENLPKIKENKSIILDWIYKNTEFLRDYILT